MIFYQYSHFLKLRIKIISQRLLNHNRFFQNPALMTFFSNINCFFLPNSRIFVADTPALAIEILNILQANVCANLYVYWSKSINKTVFY